MKSRLFFLSLLISLSAGLCSAHTQTDTLKAYHATIAPVIDGIDTDACWANGSWYPIDVFWLGGSIGANDFSGKYKLSWDKDFLYLLVETTDDSLSDQKANPTYEYWTDDCVEIFFDEDRSGGAHWYNHNAFAYHVGTKYDVVDIDVDHAAKTFNNNLVVRIDTIAPHKYRWELAIKVFSDNYDIKNPANSRRELSANEVMGLTMAYCDNDGHFTRDNFIGSINMPAGKNDVNYQTADYFGTLRLMPPVISNDVKLTVPDQVEIYPNPSCNYIGIKNNHFSSYKLITLNGQVIQSSGLNQSGDSRIDIRNLSKGLYIIELKDGAGSAIQRKIIIN